jgi:aryl-alcohol dehydrogenase-like predicted oxidoreductase
MSDMHGPADENESVATIHAALDAGITLLDTGDYYGAGHNELLIGRALRDRRDKAVLSVKFGTLRGPDGSWLDMDTRPAAVKNFLGYTLKRLGVAYIDIYRPGRLDPNVPIEETVGAIAELVTSATSAPSAYREWDPRRSVALIRSIQFLTCRSSAHWSAVLLKRGSCRSCRSLASASPHTACFRAAC